VSQENRRCNEGAGGDPGLAGCVKNLRLTIKVSNNQLKERREALGLSGFASRGQVVNLVYDPRAIHADTDIEKAVLAAVRRRPQ